MRDIEVIKGSDNERDVLFFESEKLDLFTGNETTDDASIFATLAPPPPEEQSLLVAREDVSPVFEATPTAHIDEEKEIELFTKIAADKGRPLDEWEITALLETSGLRDVDAQNEWKATDLFELSQRLIRHIDRISFATKERKIEKQSAPLRIIKNYTKGAMFALPMMIQLVSMTVVGFGVWSYAHFSLRDATSIAIGTLLALATTGGLSQMIGRKGLYYIKMDELLLAAKVTKRLYFSGILLVVLWAFASLLLNMYFKLMPLDMFELYLTYYCLLSVVFLSFAIFYMFEAFVSISLMILLGICSVYILFTVFRINIFYSQAISILLILAVSNIIIFHKLRGIARKTFSEGYLLPNAASLFYSLYPYFLFGTAYFLFIITDRALAWSTSRKFLPYTFWFNSSYETGADWALIPLIFTLALVEVFIHELGYLAFGKICRVKAVDVKSFNEYFVKIYGIAALSFIAVGVMSIFAAITLPYLIEKNGVSGFVELCVNYINIFVFTNTSIGYVLLSWSLLNCIVFFSYSRTEFALKSIGLALLTNFILGYTLSRSFEYYYSAVGLLTGSIVFAVFSTYYAHKIFKSYDYNYYSSY